VSRTCSNYSVGGADRPREELGRQFPPSKEPFGGIQPPEGSLLSDCGRIQTLGSITTESESSENTVLWRATSLRRLKGVEGFRNLPGNLGRLQTPRRRKTFSEPKSAVTRRTTLPSTGLRLSNALMQELSLHPSPSSFAFQII
jgi:hypothetical protein